MAVRQDLALIQRVRRTAAPRVRGPSRRIRLGLGVLIRLARSGRWEPIRPERSTEARRDLAALRRVGA
ncbi:hypothetical protein ACFWM1_00075 [Nocardia sp. NPDC058379]|uniref:hypothetical protein n=1 Tax=unclassified Nocardia TaxID=2637762 RepID=UPI003649FFC4